VTIAPPRLSARAAHKELHPSTKMQLLLFGVLSQIHTVRRITRSNAVNFRFMTSIMSNNKNNKGGAIVKSDEKIGVKQLFDDESSTYTYLLWDATTKDSIIVDPVDIQVNRDLAVAQDMGLNLVFGVNTHMHADHITGTGLLKQKVPGLQSVISDASGAQADIKLGHGDRIVFGSRFVEARSTPGHTAGCKLSCSFII
jgi:glyoxylase-like metal-dependent hydrolase (beta-lactamase superfamily II)